MAKILIIDDEVKLRENICELLLFVGYDVLEARDGIEGLEKLVQFRPDLIICDIMMPLLDGYGFMEKQQLSDYSNIPVIFLSAKLDQKDIEKGLALGVKEFFTKPFVFKELKQSIENYLLSYKKSQ
ncbi:response regulator [Flavobacterium cellulosilyticum]|uniref:Response regulator n=1 Tax=Flavobacterium cellulosilyticum TaxID=2541731 RepID=A0A4R5C7H2_9FLAO|nr:response regulator [Flavobacterium cellulosilyticum]TDD95055.1 response regulator [Flavobacterium cellulosilyticum]